MRIECGTKFFGKDLFCSQFVALRKQGCSSVVDWITSFLVVFIVGPVGPTLYLFFWKNIISEHLKCFMNTKCKVLKIRNFKGSVASQTYQSITNFSEKQIINVEKWKLFRISNQALNEMQRIMHAFVLHACLSSITFFKRQCHYSNDLLWEIVLSLLFVFVALLLSWKIFNPLRINVQTITKVT